MSPAHTITQFKSDSKVYGNRATFLFLVNIDISQTTKVGNMTVMCYMQQNCLNIHLNSYMILILEVLEYTK